MEIFRTGFIPVLAGLFAVVSSQTNSVRYNLTEDLRAGTDLGDLLDDSGLTTDAALPEVVYVTFTDDTAPNVELFEIHLGRTLRLAREIDRDTLCPYMDQCTVSLDLQLQPPAYFRIIKVDVEILDTNDNRPTFSRDRFQRSISEAAVVGTRIPLPSADDLDSPAFGIDYYEINGSNENAIFQQIPGYLVLNGKLDREIQDMYYIRVVAYDRGQPPLYGETVVEISVLDVNDNAPEFEQDTYSVSVREDMRPVQPVLQVTAVDPDHGDNAVVFYALDDSSIERYGNLFEINSESGVIDLIGHLNYEDTPSVSLSVIATNQDPASPSDFATVEISVEDVNDNAPAIKVHGLENGTITKPETANAASGEGGVFIAYVTVTDKDSGLNGEFTCDLIGGASQIVLKKMFDTGYVIETTSPLDREFRPSYDVTIACSDRGIPQQRSTQRMRIVIEDINDNVPVFIQDVYMARMTENNEPNYHILQVSARDRDSGRNGEVKYRFAPDTNVDRLLHLDTESGNISAKVSLDRESSSRLEFGVVAYDQGDPSLSSTASVILDILDQDDSKPVFSQPQYVFWIFEGQSAKSFVGQVNASDSDSEQYNSFLYGLPAYTDRTTVPFSIEATTGKLYSEEVLDREATSTYRFLVVADSRGITPASGVATVIVNVADVNDNAPIIRYPTAYNNTVYTGNDVSLGVALARIQATDADIGANAQLSFFILSGNPDGYFDIDPNTGVVTVARTLLDFEDKAFGLVVAVQDHGTPPKSNEAYLNIIVNRSLADSSGNLLSSQHVTIVVIIATVSGFLVVLLSVSIALLVRWPHILACRKPNKATKYNHSAAILNQKLNNAAAVTEDVEQPRSLPKSHGSPDIGHTNFAFTLDVTPSRKPGLMAGNTSGAEGVAWPSDGSTGHHKEVRFNYLFIV